MSPSPASIRPRRSSSVTLNRNAAERVLSDLHRICKEDGLTAVISLHQVEFARRFADRIVGLRRGQIVFDGTAKQLDSAAVARIYAAGDPPPALAAE